MNKKDQFELIMDEKRAKLQDCKEYKKNNSCFDCEKIFDCDIRKEYVNSVYNSMSKGQNSGGFDF